MKLLQKTETIPIAYDTANIIAMTGMTENLHQHILNTQIKLSTIKQSLKNSGIFVVEVN